MDTYPALEHHPLPGDARICRPPSNRRMATLDSPAVDVMTDLTQVAAVVIEPNTTMEAAHAYMMRRGVRMLLALVSFVLGFGLYRPSTLQAEEETPSEIFNRICSKHVDFVICDAWLCPLVAVELDGSSHRRIDRQQRDKLVDDILKGASLEIVHIPRQKRYFHKEIRELLFPKLFPAQLL